MVKKDTYMNRSKSSTGSVENKPNLTRVIVQNYKGKHPMFAGHSLFHSTYVLGEDTLLSAKSEVFRSDRLMEMVMVECN